MSTGFEPVTRFHPSAGFQDRLATTTHDTIYSPFWERTRQELNLLIFALQANARPFCLMSKIRRRELNPRDPIYRIGATNQQRPRRITPPSGFEPKRSLRITRLANFRLTIKTMVAKSNQYRHAHRVVRSVKLDSKHDDKTVVDVFTFCAIVK